MLRFSTERDGSGRMRFQHLGFAFGLTVPVGATFPGVLQGYRQPSPRIVRSDLDYIETGPRLFAGDRECKHQQISADCFIQPTVSGGVIPYDQFYGIAPANRSQPSDPAGYTFEEMLAQWGVPYVEGRRMQWRTPGSSRYTTTTNQAYPCIFGSGGSQVGYTGYQRQKSSQRFGSDAALQRTFVLPQHSDDLPITVVIQIGCSTIWGSTGAITLDGCSATIYVVALAPSSPGSSDIVRWSFSPSKGWTTKLQSFPLPPNLVSLTRDDFRTFVRNPSLLDSIPELGSVSRSGLPVVPATYVAPTTVVLDGDISNEVIESVKAELNQFLIPLLLYPSVVKIEDDWNELGDTAADNILQVSINTLQYFMDLRKITETMKETFKLTSQFRNPKAWASWWLSLRYGDRLTFNDSVELSNAVSSTIRSGARKWKKDFYTTHSRSRTTGTSTLRDLPNPTVYHNLKLYYKPRFDDDVSKAIVWAMKWDLWPTLTNAWDMIPLSFVADWFVDVGGFLESTDRENMMLMHRVLSVLCTEKRIFNFDDRSVNGCTISNLQVTQYTRNRRASLPSAPFRVDRGHLSSINVVDGLSLLFLGAKH